MREVDFQRERLYQATMHIVRNMLAEGMSKLLVEKIMKILEDY